MGTSSTLDKILDSYRNPIDKKGLGFESGQSSMSALVFIKEGTFIGSSELSYERCQSSRSTQFYQKGSVSSLITEATRSKEGKYRNISITPFTRQVCVRKLEVICYPTIVLTATMTEARWYFESGCSRYMTRNAKYLMCVQPSSGSVIFGDGQKRKIVGKGIINVSGLPHLDEVYLVSGLRASLISISQLCDQNWNVCFNRDCCSVRDKADGVVRGGTRSSNN
ncbi:PREDICTED: uncharacterized protein LOC109179520 [Ipomoea nil]|uniref:uncharacterized protein LOC109179520 n=1 Tax=Ipomoea nil TaxID=35883 RepID=UPI000900FBFC|nr:PREDICTED: uncharacterized protein LOC109179520 [Ipomoea nil]